MNNWELIDESAVKFTLANGRELIADVSIHVTPDDESVDGSFDFGDETENAAYLARFESGELANVCIRVTAEWSGLTGTDYLGGCHVHAGNHIDVKQTVACHDMFDLAVKELTDRVNELNTKLNG